MAKEQFKTTDALFGKIAEDFASFSQAQLFDEGRFYKDVVYILNLLGIAWFREAEEVLEVKNYKCELPCDFEVLDSAYKCESTHCGSSTNNGIFDGMLTQGLIINTDGLVLSQFSMNSQILNPDYHVTPCACDDTCCPTGYKYNTSSKMCDCNDIDTSPNCLAVAPISCCLPGPNGTIFNNHTVTVVRRENDFFQYRNPTLLRLGNVQTKRRCKTGCENTKSTSRDTITIEGNHIYTNFREGSIYLTYHALPLDEETKLPLIPNNEIIEKCIEYYIKKNIIENLWINGDADVDRKVSYFKNEYKEHLGQAMYQTKLPSFQTMVNQIRIKRKSLNVYQLNTNPI